MTSAPNDAEIIEIFPTPIMTVRWSQAERRNPELIQAILAKEMTHPGVNRSNKGGWHSRDDLPQWAGEAGRELLNFAVEVANTATERVMMGQPLAPHQWKVIMWANVNRAGQFNAVHVHPRSTWSGCYYVDPGERDPDNPDCGCFSMHNPKGAEEIGFLESPLMPPVKTIAPEAGLMVLFPSYLVHGVNPYYGERPRISIAFNLMKDPYP